MKKTIQISPHGIFEKVEEDKSRVAQLCDAAAFAAVVADWERRGRPKILLDYLHKRGEAAGWIVALRADPAEGLLGDVEYTPPGAQAVAEKLYRFPSADWLVSADGRPFQLRTVGLTNTPNIPVRPVSNSAAVADEQNPQQKEKPKMEAIKKKLGLPPEADEAAVEAAVQALLDQAAAAQAAATNAKAQTVAVANAARIQNSQAFIAAYVQAPDAVDAALAALKPPAAPAAEAPRRVVNSAGAQAPAQAAAAAARKFASKDEARAALAKVPVGQRKAFFAEHQSSFED